MNNKNENYREGGMVSTLLQATPAALVLSGGIILLSEFSKVTDLRFSKQNLSELSQNGEKLCLSKLRQKALKDFQNTDSNPITISITKKAVSDCHEKQLQSAKKRLEVAQQKSRTILFLNHLVK